MELHSIGALRIVSQHQGRAWLTVSQHQGRAMLSVSEGWADTSMRAPSSCLPASHSTSPPPHSPPPSFSSRETHLISFSSSPPWRRPISRSYDLHWLRLLSLSSSLTNYLPLTKNCALTITIIWSHSSSSSHTWSGLYKLFHPAIPDGRTIPHICHFFTQAKFSAKKIYTEIYTVNCQFTQWIANFSR